MYKLAYKWNIWKAAVQWVAHCHYFDKSRFEGSARRRATLTSFLRFSSTPWAKCPTGHNRTNQPSIPHYIISATGNVIKSEINNPENKVVIQIIQYTLAYIPTEWNCPHSVLQYSIFTFHIDNNIEIFYCIITLRSHHNAVFLKCEVLYYWRKLYSIYLDNNLSHITNLLLYHFLFVTLQDGRLLRRFIQQTLQNFNISRAHATGSLTQKTVYLCHFRTVVRSQQSTSQ